MYSLMGKVSDFILQKRKQNSLMTYSLINGTNLVICL